MTFTIKSAKFIDSLSNLSDNLYDNGKGFDKLVHTKSLFKNHSDEDVKLIMKKIPYPYEWINKERLLENSPMCFRALVPVRPFNSQILYYLLSSLTFTRI
eukprot:Lithocolla_globosa_v1_NODE_360_length_4320_cov_124.833529.p4 type:complete len:100 gc:universal NODE_360_length_4320_cov_124.833529:2365-2066(-)